MAPENVWAVIPAQNEAATIARVVEEARRHVPTVVVVDDASSDDTAALAKAAGAIVLPLVCSLDAWCAAQTGLRFALARGAQVVITLDADGQHPTERIGDLLAPVLAGSADVAIASDPARVSGYRHLAWRYLRALTGLPIVDLTSGFRAYGPAALESLASARASSLNYQDIGVLMMLRELGLRMQELPVSMSAREHGSSHVFRSWLKVFAYLLESTVIGLAHGRKAAPVSRGSA